MHDSHRMILISQVFYLLLYGQLNDENSALFCSSERFALVWKLWDRRITWSANWKIRYWEGDSPILLQVGQGVLQMLSCVNKASLSLAIPLFKLKLKIFWHRHFYINVQESLDVAANFLHHSPSTFWRSSTTQHTIIYREGSTFRGNHRP